MTFWNYTCPSMLISIWCQKSDPRAKKKSNTVAVFCEKEKEFPTKKKHEGNKKNDYIAELNWKWIRPKITKINANVEQKKPEHNFNGFSYLKKAWHMLGFLGFFNFI